MFIDQSMSYHHALLFPPSFHLDYRMKGSIPLASSLQNSISKISSISAQPFPFPTKSTVHYKIAYTFATSLLQSLRTAFCLYGLTRLRSLGCLLIYSFLHFLSYSQHLCISKLREWQTYGLFKDTGSAYSQGNISSDLQHH